MTSKEFVIWLKGYLAAANDSGCINFNVIGDQLDKVSDEPNITEKDEKDNWEMYNKGLKPKTILHD